MSIVPYNSSNEIVYHDPSHGILVLHDNQDNTLQLVSTTNEAYNNKINLVRNEDRSGPRYGNNKPHSNIKCPNCGFAWSEHSNIAETTKRRTSDSLNELMDSLKSDPDNTRAMMKNFPEGFMHHDYFKLLGKLPYNQKPRPRPATNLPENIFNQGYFKRFFKKVPPFMLGSGAHSQVYKVVHVLNDIKLGTYAVKRISIGDKIELLEQVLNEVLILYELSIQGANENNLIRYNHVWLELGDIQDLKTYFLPDKQKNSEFDNKIPYVFILQQYCDGGHLEDLIEKVFLRELHLSAKEQLDLERQRRRSVRKNSNQKLENMDPENKENKKPWLNSIEIWKFFRDVAKGVHYLHLHGILHRDLKPSNCLLDYKYNNRAIDDRIYENENELNQEISKLPKVLVSDFGEGQFIDKHNLPQDDITIKNMSKDEDERRGNTGTLEFTAPELWIFSNFDPSLGSERQYFINEFTYESDIYSLGLILCWLCAGKLPFTHMVKGELDPQLIRDKILDWYFDLNAAKFHEWFVSSVRIESENNLLRDNCVNDFEKLIYLMIKGDDSSEPTNSRPNRLLSNDVIKFLDAIKWKRFIMENEIIQESSEETTNKYGLIPVALLPSNPDDAIDPDFIYQSDDITSEDDEVHDIANSEYEDDSALKLSPRDTFSSYPPTKSKIFNVCIILGYMLNILLFDTIDNNIFYTYKLSIKIFILALFTMDLLLLESTFIRVSCLVLAFSLPLVLAIVN
ncbi:uncharacterized protein AC631_04128 [Debaryomyces fabryi]|uniref:Protein kinase domain-containing protein n=1 Tax=Debaryomyces fabryi TaxID=58627 RepID=A0A0V1PVY3_9ASCO|nr:uncharacterized protein AC631_04128 [Debaryomyces fabryi]KSA00127.1 hypothetical protein AC631_04128 [Debaryomyces fabryi]CUM57011.1 unnamed protein product [Debaryomyces fabryi]